MKPKPDYTFVYEDQNNLLYSQVLDSAYDVALEQMYLEEVDWSLKLKVVLVNKEISDGKCLYHFEVYYGGLEDGFLA